jgi:cytochrome oxidase Cu insertion factor (SCO1/SenC/PrrC family)
MQWKSMGLVVAGAIAVLAAGGWVLESWLAAPQPSQGEALIESEFSLVDHTGNPVADEDFAGKWQLVFFGFTACPDVCPTTLIEVSAVLEELGDDAEQITPLFISVDPERDTPEVMAEYVANFDPRIVGQQRGEVAISCVSAAPHTVFDLAAAQADVSEHGIVHCRKLPHVAADAQLMGDRDDEPRQAARGGRQPFVEERRLVLARKVRTNGRAIMHGSFHRAWVQGSQRFICKMGTKLA